MFTHATISGLKSAPRQFRWGTLLRILRKYGANRTELNRIHRRLNNGLPAKFKHFELFNSLVSDQEVR